MLDTSIKAIANRIATQDNACTGHPIFVVEQRERIYGAEDDNELFVWHDDDWNEVDKLEAEAAEAEYQRTGDAPRGWIRQTYVERWSFVQPFFTMTAAEAYLEANSHRLTDPRVFVGSAYRNPEWQAVVAFLPVAVRCITAAHAVVEYIGRGVARTIGELDVREARRRIRTLREALPAKDGKQLQRVTLDRDSA